MHATGSPPDALEQLRHKIHQKDLAIADRPWTTDQLFTMSQISLLRLDRVMRQLRMSLEFANIPFVPKTQANRLRTAA